MKHVFQIKYLDIRASYFKGKVGFEEDEFTITIQAVSYTHLTLPTILLV